MITTIAISAVILCTMIAILVYHAKIDFILKLSVLPFAIFFLVVCAIWITDNIGAPIAGTPKNEFEYIHHELNGTKEIYIWVFEKKRGSRVYVIPYDRERAKELEKGKTKKNEGMSIKGKILQLGRGGEFKIELEATLPNSGRGPVKDVQIEDLSLQTDPYQENPAFGKV